MLWGIPAIRPEIRATAKSHRVIDNNHFLVVTCADGQFSVENKLHPAAREGAAVGQGKEILGRGHGHGGFPA